MEKIFEIVSSLIPEEQKDDIKSKIDGAVKENITQVKKELSAKYDVDFFTEDIDKAYSNKHFVKKDLLDVELEKVKTFETQLAEALAFQETNKGLVEEQKLYQSSLNLISQGFRVDRLDLIKPHITGDVELDATTIKEKYPELYNGKVENKSMFPKGNTETLSGFQKYIQEKTQKK